MYFVNFFFCWVVLFLFLILVFFSNKSFWLDMLQITSIGLKLTFSLAFCYLLVDRSYVDLNADIILITKALNKTWYILTWFLSGIFWLVMRAMPTSQQGHGTGSDSCATGQRVTGVGLGGLLWKASGRRWHLRWDLNNEPESAMQKSRAEIFQAEETGKARKAVTRNRGKASGQSWARQEGYDVPGDGESG